MGGCFFSRKEASREGNGVGNTRSGSTFGFPSIYCVQSSAEVYIKRQGEDTKGEQVKSYSSQCPSARTLIRTNQCYALPAPSTMLRYARQLASRIASGRPSYAAPRPLCTNSQFARPFIQFHCPRLPSSKSSLRRIAYASAGDPVDRRPLAPPGLHGSNDDAVIMVMIMVSRRSSAG